jgi:Spy/CpxP family protein refolding chaperone
MVEHVSDELDLNDTQAQSLRSLADELVELKTLMRENMSADGQAIRDMLVADSFDRARAIDMIDAKTTAIQDNAPTIVTALGTFLDGLTQEQKAEIAQRMDHHGNHHRGRHHD